MPSAPITSFALMRMDLPMKSPATPVTRPVASLRTWSMWTLTMYFAPASIASFAKCFSNTLRSTT